MNITEILDLAIKKNEKGSAEGGYNVEYKGKTLYKPTYMTNDEWLDFLANMTPDAKKEYGEGGGDELSEKNGHPPKMACYGSSSRMIYNLSREKENFHFEKKLPTTVGGTANLDGFMYDGGRYLFVEAKCHEIYKATRTVVSKRYGELYDYINEQMDGELEIRMWESRCGKNLNVEFFAQGEKVQFLDLKQMICHLLGIATGMLKGTLKPIQSDFVYLLYDPTDLCIEGEAGEIIEAVYERTREECMSVEFDRLFAVILNFLMEKYYPNALTPDEAEEVASKFFFVLASQDFYPYLIGTKG